MKRREIARRAAVYLALLTVAVAQPLLQLYADNVAVFAAANYEGSIVVWFALAVLLVPPAVFTVVDAAVLVFAPRIERHVHRGLVFVALWAVMSVLARSVSFGPWVVDALVTAVLAGAVLTAFVRFAAVRSWLVFMSPLALVVAVTFGATARAVIAPPEAVVIDIKKPVTPAGPGTPKDKVSVLWIVLDEAPLFSLLDSNGAINARRFPGFADLASTSTWYRNVVATSQTTTDAVPAMLTGRMPRSGVGPVLANHPKNLFTLMNGHMSMDAHEVVTALCPKEVCRTVSVSGGEHVANPTGEAPGTTTTAVPASDIVSAKPRTPFSSFVKDAAIVVGHKMLPKGLRERLPPIDEGWGGFGNADNVDEDIEEPVDTTVAAGPTTTAPLTEETREDADNTTVREWEDGGPQTQIPVVEGVIARAARADRATLHFVHALIPHRPWVLAPDMRASLQLPADKRSIQVLDGRRDRLQIHLSQYAATDRVIADMMAALRRSANWDRTMIIVTADHGITFQQGEKHRETVNVKSPGTLEDLYRVPLFVKYPDQNTAAVSDCTASPVDLLATVSAATGIDAGWKTDGADLLTSCPQRDSRTVIWPDGRFDMSTSFADVMKRVEYYDKWIDADGTVDDIYRGGLSGSLVGTTVPAGAGTETSLSWSLKEAGTYNTAGTGKFAPVVTRSRGSLSASRDFAATEEALLVMDGVVFGVVSELAGLKKGTSTEFTCIPMSRLHTPGAHTMELWTVDWADPSAPVFRKVTR